MPVGFPGTRNEANSTMGIKHLRYAQNRRAERIGSGKDDRRRAPIKDTREADSLRGAVEADLAATTTEGQGQTGSGAAGQLASGGEGAACWSEKNLGPNLKRVLGSSRGLLPSPRRHVLHRVLAAT